ncbi:MAG: nuclear transport factor 2 family protein [Arenicellales bacterium]
MSTAIENADVIRRAYAAFNAGDIDILTETFDENAAWHTPGRSPIAGDSRGREAVFAQFGRYAGGTDGTFKATLQHILRSDDGRIVGVHHNSGERKGKQLDMDCCILFEVKAGRIISAREHFYDQYAWDDFWA